MRYITPDIINKINSTEEIEDDIKDLWNTRLSDLQNNYELIKNSLPVSVLSFIEKHDFTNYNVFSKSNNLKTDEYAFVIGSCDINEIYYISYDFYEDASIEVVTGTGFTNALPAVWLYDEFHIGKNCFEHHIIFSDGHSYIMPFKSFSVRKTGWFLED